MKELTWAVLFVVLPILGTCGSIAVRRAAPVAAPEVVLVQPPADTVPVEPAPVDHEPVSIEPDPQPEPEAVSVVSDPEPVFTAPVTPVAVQAQPTGRWVRVPVYGPLGRVRGYELRWQWTTQYTGGYRQTSCVGGNCR